MKILNNIKKNLKFKNLSLYFFITLIIISFTITYILLIPDSDLVKDKSNIIRLLILDIIIVITLIALIIRQIFHTYFELL